MVDYIKLRKGLDVPIAGTPSPHIKENIISDTVAVKPTDFRGIIPRLLVKEGDQVKAGSPIFADKARPNILFTSPVSGTVEEIVRGEKRKLLEIRIKADKQTEYLNYSLAKLETMTEEEIKNLLLESGLWACIKQRPYGIIPNPEVAPKAIFISAFNTAPLAPDYDYSLQYDFDNIQTAINALTKLTKGGIHMGLSTLTHASTPFHKLSHVNFHIFDGKHPAGNVGVQIHHVSPINKGETVWTISMPHLAAIGKFFRKGIYDMSKVVAVTGPRVDSPCYVRGVSGMSLKPFKAFASENVNSLQKGCDVRYISGDVLTGKNVGLDGFLGFYDDQVTMITEGSYYEMFGWGNPFRFKKFSVHRTYFSWIFPLLNPKQSYNMDSNLNGGERAFVMSGEYEKVLPMNIYPVYLLKAILAGNIDKMEELGIYEVVEEDFALCEYVCTSKIEVQSIISDGIDMMIKEMS